MQFEYDYHGFKGYLENVGLTLTLLLSNEDAEDILTMDECLDALDQSYRELSNGLARSARRSDIVTKTPSDDAVYSLKMMGGVVPGLEVAVVRINSDILTWPETDGVKRRVKVPSAPGDRWVGLVLLFSIQNSEPLAIFPDGVVQRMRVGGASGLGVKYLARKNAKSVALIGSGWQAGAQAMAAATVRDLETICCFSPNQENREAFCREMEPNIGVEIRPMDSAQAAVKDADIVLCATNSFGNVFTRNWIEPGMHLGAIRDGELEPAAIAAADVLVIHDVENLSNSHILPTGNLSIPDQGKEVTSDPKLKDVAGAPLLADVVAGKVKGRTGDDQVTCFLNYHGLGFQFAAAGMAFYKKARELGRGRELPTEWFTEDVHA